MSEEGKKSSFKVVDRRRFDEDGDERTGPDVKAKEDPRPAPAPKPAAAHAPSAPAAGQAAADAQGAPGAAGAQKGPPSGLTFTVFLQSLAQQALMQLGLIPWPHGQRELQLDAARDTIDIMALLKDKTKGNLSPEETQYLDRALYELRMGAIEVEQAIMRSRGAQMVPGMGPGGPLGPNGPMGPGR
jgi:hypothetical protein